MPKNGTQRIIEERERQINALDWSPEHDDSHVFGELLEAAQALILDDPAEWPWSDTPMTKTWYGVRLTDEEWEKELPNWEAHRIKQLTKAGALIAAEIDRLLRKQERLLSNIS